VGEGLLAAGRVREAWMYLKPVGDRTSTAAALEKIEPDDENVEELIEVALHHGVHPSLGFELVLGHYGTCNAISMFDGEMHDRPAAIREEVAGVLIRHLHAELLQSVKADIARQEGSQPAETTLAELVADRDWLFDGDNYHIDTSHLGAVVRFSRLVTSPEMLSLAADLTEYGRRLAPQFQSAGEEPFADAYADQGLFFRAQLGQQVDEALAFFRDKATSLDPAEHGTGPLEVYVALLSRLGRNSEAMDALAELLPAGARVTGFAPTMGELAKRSAEFTRMMTACRHRGDLLGFTASLVENALAAGQASNPPKRSR
jgi:hypothetical protein